MADKAGLLEELAACRVDAGLTVYDVADRMGYPPAKVTAIERDGDDISVMERYASAIGVIISYSVSEGHRG